MKERLRFFLHRLQERLWVKPLLICLVSILIAFLANMADQVKFLQNVPAVRLESLNTMLNITSGSMLGVATFAVGSMVTAYASAGSTATPRSFVLILADDVSQNTLSSFIGALIFSIVAKLALENEYYGQPGRFLLFIISVIVFGIIIINFVRWFDRIARLGRLGYIIDMVESVTKRSILWRKRYPTLGGTNASKEPSGDPIYSQEIGYLLRINVRALQKIAEEFDLEIHVAELPGSFMTLDKPLCYINPRQKLPEDWARDINFSEAFTIDDDRVVDQDPCFGVVILSEIGSRALSAAVNDSGTAIDIIGSFIRLFSLWVRKEGKNFASEVKASRVFVPEISPKDLFDDAFNALARDGADKIEVALWLQKAFKALAALGNDEFHQEAYLHAQLAYHYAEKALKLPEELDALKNAFLSIEPYPQNQDS